MNNLKKLAIATFILIAAIALPVQAQQQTRLDPAFNVIADKTISVHGNDIARVFTQLLLIRELRPLSTLVLLEERSDSNSKLISLSTPLREITTHKFQPSMVRTWLDAEVIAEHFVRKAISSGLLKPSLTDEQKPLKGDSK